MERLKSNMQLKLLSHQFQLLNELKHKIIGMSAGFGSGKTFIATRKHVTLVLLNPGCDSIITEPNYPLLTQILLPEMHRALKEFGIAYVFKAGESIFYCSVLNKKTGMFEETRIICKSMESYDRLIGINASHITLDEFDTTKAEVAYEAYLKLLGRLRVGSHRHMIIVSTPEGFRAMHRIFVEEADNEKILIKAKSTDNPYLPDDFIDTMRAQYSEALIAAYINGEFTNLTSGTVYTSFDRQDNDTERVDDGRSDVVIGMDFNITKMSAVAGVYKDHKLYLYKEFEGYYDTPSLIEAVKAEFPNRRIIVYPDATGSNRGSQSGDTTNHALLRAAGFVVRTPNSNPGILDRVNTVNAGFKNALHETRVYVNVNTCTSLVKGLEQNAYDPKTNLPEKGLKDFHLGDGLGYLVVGLIPIRPRDRTIKSMGGSNNMYSVRENK